MNQTYTQFERQSMIRKDGQLVAPIISMQRDLQLPQNSLLHYLGDSKIDVGPTSDNPLFKSLNKPIMVYTPLELVKPPSAPRYVKFDVNAIMRGYLVRHRRMRKVVALKNIPRDVNTLAVVNYALIHHNYKYVRSMFADYNEWKDLHYTVTSTMNEAANLFQRNQFLIIGVPQILPGLSRLQNAARTMDQNAMKLFHTPESRMLLELWKWFDEEPHENIFDRIEPKNYRYINLIIMHNGQWTAVNLARLHYWKKSTKDKLLADNPRLDPDTKKLVNVVHPNFQLQKYLLRLCITMQSAGSLAGIDADAPVQEAMNLEDDQVAPEQRGQAKPAAKPVDESGMEQTENEDGVLGDEELRVKKAEDLSDSSVSSRNSNAPEVKSSTQLLMEAAKVTQPHGEDDDSSKFELNDDVNKMIDADLAELETLNSSAEAKEIERPSNEEILPLAVVDDRSYEKRLKDRCATLAESGLLTAAEYRRLHNLSEKFNKLPNPHGGPGTLVEAMEVHPEELHVDTEEIVAPNATVIDESMLKSSVERTQQKYIKHTLPKHILQMISHVQNNGMIIDELEVERTENVLGANHNYRVRIVPIEGAPTTLRFPIPEIQEDGTYIANGVKYAMRQQRGDQPIRKIASNKVALTSYYGKFFIYRSRKSVNDYGQWLVNLVLTEGLDPTKDRISDVRTSNVFDMRVKAPRSITSLSKQIKQFTVKVTADESFVFYLDFSKVDENYSKAVVQPWIEKGFMPVAISNKKNIIYYEGDSFYLIKGEKVEPLGELEEMLGIDIAGAPTEYCELKIAGKYVPIGMILAWDYGLSELVKRLKIKTRRVPVGTRVQQQPDEVALVFSDETLLFSKQDRMACLLLGGFLEFKRVIRGFTISDFDSKGVYQSVLDTTGGGTRVLREIVNARDLFVDPITKKVLTDLKLPTDFMSILVYSTELLMDDMHRPELDMSEMRLKGYERVAGAVYQGLVRSLRAHHARPGKSRYPIEMKPFAIWQSLAEDPSIVVVKDINPISNLKLREEVTFTGAGGRSKDTMTASTREYGENDPGLISEATKDSGEVGINTYTPPNPQIKNTLGMPKAKHEKKLEMSSIFSSSVLASPGATRDDMKRIGFISIQHDHGVAVKGQRENILATGYERVIPHRTTELYAISAKQAGVVKEKTDHGITVQYADGTSKSYPLGRHYGDNAGMVIPHKLESNLEVGKKFAAGDAITYNSGYFKPDTLNPNQVTWCNGTYATIALCEPSDVIEDASVISQEFADMLMTEQTKKRTIIVNFNQSIARLIKVGEQVKYDDVLCIVQDEITTGMDIYDEADIDTLKALGSMAPKAKYDGVVERIEVFYRGDKEDMSEAIRKIVTQSDRDLATRRKAANKAVVTGQVDEGFKEKGNSIPLDSVAIRIYITGPESAGVGDKIVFGNQLKSIVGNVIKEPMRTKDGRKVLGRFSYTSVARRIVNSADISGTTIPILIKGGELAVEAYDS